MMEKKELSVIGNYGLYDINQLIAIWNKGWKNFAEFCENYLDLMPMWHIRHYSDDYDFKQIEKILCAGLKEVLMYIEHEIRNETDKRGKCCYLKGLLEYGMLHFAIFQKKKVKKTDLPFCFDGNLNESREAISKITEAFQKSKTIGDVFKCLAVKKTLNDFRKVWPMDIDSDDIFNVLYPIPITENLAKKMYWINYGLQNKDYKAAWWNCVWLTSESEIEEMLNIQKYIRDDVPLTQGQIELLDNYMQYGRPQLYWCHKKNECGMFDLKLDPVYIHDINLYPLEQTSTYLLIQPAFLLAQQLRNACREDRYIRKCHAPSCEREFYTGHKDAVACSSKNLRGKKSHCLNEWTRYRRWLTKIGKNPETDWDIQELKDKFLTQDNQ